MKKEKPVLMIKTYGKYPRIFTVWNEEEGGIRVVDSWVADYKVWKKKGVVTIEVES